MMDYAKLGGFSVLQETILKKLLVFEMLTETEAYFLL